MAKKYQPITFPKDELPHNNIIEWWYFNGNLKDAQGNEYSFMDCLFKADVKKVNIPFLDKVPFKTLYFSHSLLCDLRQKNTTHRISPLSMVSDDSFSKPDLFIHYTNAALKKGQAGCIMEKTGENTYHIKNEDIDLDMVSVKPPLLEGGKGFFDYHPKQTYYYSLTNLTTEGKIKINNAWVPVKGKSWMDHQWSDTKYIKNIWDWFSIQLNDNTEIISFVYDDHQVKTYLADISYPDGRQEHYSNIEMIKTGRFWQSQKSKANYPLSYTIKIPEKNISLQITAAIEDGEILFGTINYWEGQVRVEGVMGDKKVTGTGFMELVGY